MLADIRSAARGLLRSPTVAVSGILCLALGIGTTAAISSAINRALFQSLPFREPDRVVAIHRTTPQSGPLGTWPLSPATYTDLAQRARRIDGIRLVIFGLVLGSLGGVLMTRLLSFALYGVSPLDVETWAASLLLMVVAGATAALIPARRATHVSPLIAIQTE